MNFQEKMLESTADLRARAAAIANVAVTTARARAEVAAKRVNGLKGSFAALTIAGREFNKVARHHAIRFVKQNSTLASEVRDDVSALARSTFASLTAKPAATTRKASPRKASPRKRARKAAH